MPNLTPTEASKLITHVDKYIFLLPGSAAGKGFWLDNLREALETYSEGAFEVGSIGGIDGIKHPGDAVSRVKLYNPDAVVAFSDNERQVRGIAMTLGYRFLVVDNYLLPEDRSFFPYVVPVSPNSNYLSPAIIVDLDGTLVNSKHRNTYGNRYDLSEEAILRDTTFPHVEEIVRMYYGHGVKIIYLTARGGETPGEEDITLKWLAGKGLLFNRQPPNNTAELITRHPKDIRSDVVFKLETFNERIRGKYDIKLVVEDRPQIVRMWQDLGLPVLSNYDYSRGDY